MNKHRDPKSVEFVAAMRRRGRVACMLGERDEFFVVHCRKIAKINYPRTKSPKKKLSPTPRGPYRRRSR